MSDVHYDCCLYDSRAVTGLDPDPEDEDNARRMFLIQLFGKNAQGSTYVIQVKHFQPFFFVMLSRPWTKSECIEFRSFLESQLRLRKSNAMFNPKDMCPFELTRWHKMDGFDNNALHYFLRLSFKSNYAMEQIKSLWYEDGIRQEKNKVNTPGVQFPSRKLIKEGVFFPLTQERVPLYEGNITPLLRFFHCRQIPTSGWVRVTNPSLRKTNEFGSIELVCDYNQLFPIQSAAIVNQRVPWKIVSFDIEASSSHGDFPLPVKSHKKLVTSIVDAIKNNFECQRNVIEWIQRAILTAYGFDDLPNIDRIYPKHPCTEEDLRERFTTWYHGMMDNTLLETKNTLEVQEQWEERSKVWLQDTTTSQDDDAKTHDDETDDDGDDEEVGEEASHKIRDRTMDLRDLDEHHNAERRYPFMDDMRETNHIARVRRTKRWSRSLIDILVDEATSKDDLILLLNHTFYTHFPVPEGDKVTFIGSSFRIDGQLHPYKEHVIVLGTCDPLADGVHRECYATEKEVLLAWTRLIQRENPEFITGYYINGFDFDFMYHRAKECDCVNEFLRLSPIVDEICGKQNMRFQYDLETKNVRLASGEYCLRYPNIGGRVIVDLNMHYRRELSMSSYKLDYVAGCLLGDKIKSMEIRAEDNATLIRSSNLKGLTLHCYIHLEIVSNSAEYYDHGRKFRVISIHPDNSFCIAGQIHIDLNQNASPCKSYLRWCLAKDDVSPKDIFRLSNASDEGRATVAKYCLQDCNLVHYLFAKSDILTGLFEMSNLCSVPISFLVFRGQGIKLQSFVAKKCLERRILMRVFDKVEGNESFDGAMVLDPKCFLYLKEGIACLDYGSLYPSSMISENLSHDTKVWVKRFDVEGNLISMQGVTDINGNFIYDNLPGRKYVDIRYDDYEMITPVVVKKRARPVKTVSGYTVCRFIQPRHDKDKGILPSILEELMKARKTTRKAAEAETDAFLKNVLDKRQLAIKTTANSLYGGCGATTSVFYDKDIASCTTATGRMLLKYGKRIIEECYNNTICTLPLYGTVRTRASYVYGDTDSVFFKFNLERLDGTKIEGIENLHITIELAKQVGELATQFLKRPHDFEYEKTFMPFCLLSKKRYVGMMYTDVGKPCYRKEMGIVLKRRDNAPIVKDIYGGIVDYILYTQNLQEVLRFVHNQLQDIRNGNVNINKLIISKSLKSQYSKPNTIPQWVLAQRMGSRDPGNKPAPGDRIPYVFIEVSPKTITEVTKTGKVKTKVAKRLQGDCVESPAYVREHNIPIDYKYYITNQIMNPVSQFLALVMEDILREHNPALLEEYLLKKDKLNAKQLEKLRNINVQKIVFHPFTM